MNKEWIQDIMNQQFTVGTFVNPIRLIIATCLMTEPLEKVVSKRKVLEYVYRTYSDNMDVAARNPSIEIRNISNYGLKDIAEALDEALRDWCSDAINNTLTYDSNYIYLDIDETDVSIVKSSLPVIKMLYKKYFKMDLLVPKTLSENDVDHDEDIDVFGCGLYKTRLLEDMQYCPLCEETIQDNLVAVHILPNKFNTIYEERIDKNNGLIMCKQHAVDYINGLFYFAPTGFVYKSTSESVDKRMHLSFSVNCKARKEYIKRYFDLINI